MMVTKRILLVDQEPQITLLVRQALEKAGNYSVREERTGELALQAAREFRPDLILVDLIAEGADGNHFAKQFHTDVLLRDTPVVCLSSAPFRGKRRFQRISGGLQFFRYSSSHRRTDPWS